MPPRGGREGSKRERQSEHVKESGQRPGMSNERAEEMAARTANKERSEAGEAARGRKRSRKSGGGSRKSSGGSRKSSARGGSRKSSGSRKGGRKASARGGVRKSSGGRKSTGSRKRTVTARSRKASGASRSGRGGGRTAAAAPMTQDWGTGNIGGMGTTGGGLDDEGGEG